MRIIISLLALLMGGFAVVHIAHGEVTTRKLITTPPMEIDPTGHFFQVRIEQSVIIRIPRERSTPVNSPASSSPTAGKYHEEKIGKCIMMDRLVASRPGPNDSLELATRDGVIIRAYLGDGCLSREFYAGAYMERPDDGKLCVDRDMVHARTGAKCDIDKFRVIVPD